MSHARRRSAQLLFALLTAILLTFAVTSATAFAADESDEEHAEEEHAEEELSGFGTGDWDGLIMAAGAGLVFAVITFSMSSPGEIQRADDHH